VVKPLHVRVAAAFGWSDFRKEGGILLPGVDNWRGWPPGAYPIIGQPTPRKMVPRYDTDWSETGPLIEWFRLSPHPLEKSSAWGAGWWDPDEFYERVEAGPTLLIAVCELILALHTAGKLPPTP
jgi:hypothetical protein